MAFTEWEPSETDGTLVLLKGKPPLPLCEHCQLRNVYGAIHHLQVIHNAYGPPEQDSYAGADH